MIGSESLQPANAQVDTAEQYPIPSDALKPEGLTEEIIGKWVAKDKTRRDKIVVATKITGGLNVNAQNIREDLEGSLKSGSSWFVDVCWNIGTCDAHPFWL